MDTTKITFRSLTEKLIKQNDYVLAREARLDWEKNGRTRTTTDFDRAEYEEKYNIAHQKEYNERIKDKQVLFTKICECFGVDPNKGISHADIEEWMNDYVYLDLRKNNL